MVSHESKEPKKDIRALLDEIKTLSEEHEQNEYGNVSFWVDSSEPIEDPNLSKERWRLTQDQTAEVCEGLIAAGVLSRGASILKMELNIRHISAVGKSVFSIEFKNVEFLFSEKRYPITAKYAPECLLAGLTYVINREIGAVRGQSIGCTFDEVYATGHVDVTSYTDNVDRTSELHSQCYADFRTMVRIGKGLNRNIGEKFGYDLVDKGDHELLGKVIRILTVS